MSEKRRGEISSRRSRRSRHGDAPDTETLQTRRRGEFKSHAKFRSPFQIKKYPLKVLAQTHD
ncbi:MAG: hypothetical protein F6K58_02040 [Symploca sp. SIO2E9]|nr:hypothetical protein [Symploca sp. SIO2E9]